MNADAVHITGWGAVSAAGWGSSALAAALVSGEIAPAVTEQRPGTRRAVRIRRVPPPESPPAWVRHPRLRRASPITRFAVGAALEALGPERAAAVSAGQLRLGTLCTVLTGCVTFSNRFYREVLENPATASPILFPETVFNAPASHLAAVLGSTGPCDTLVGDGAQFLLAIETGLAWLEAGDVDACLVVGAEELDWLSAEAWSLFSAEGAVTEGAGAVLLQRGPPGSGILVERITDPVSLGGETRREEALRTLRRRLGPVPEPAVLIDSLRGARRQDAAESSAWADWTGDRLSPLAWFGDSLGAAGALQAALAAEWLRCGRACRAVLSAVGQEHQACAAVLAAPAAVQAAGAPPRSQTA